MKTHFCLNEYAVNSSSSSLSSSSSSSSSLSCSSSSSSQSSLSSSPSLSSLLFVCLFVCLIVREAFFWNYYVFVLQRFLKARLAGCVVFLHVYIRVIVLPPKFALDVRCRSYMFHVAYFSGLESCVRCRSYRLQVILHKRGRVFHQGFQTRQN